MGAVVRAKSDAINVSVIACLCLNCQESLGVWWILDSQGTVSNGNAVDGVAFAPHNHPRILHVAVCNTTEIKNGKASQKGMPFC